MSIKSIPLEAGQKFNRLTVLKLDHIEKNKYGCNIEFYNCICDCGNKCIVRKSQLTSKKNKSCGCYSREQTKKTLQERHKNSFKTKIFGSKILNLLNSIKRRCYNKNSINYDRYGSRGITVCQEWLDKEKGSINFYNWAIANGYNDKLEIDRIDFNGNYEPNNCRFVDIKTQARNKRNNVNIFYAGETHCIAEWADLINEFNPNLGINNNNLQLRISRYKVNLDRAFLRPVGHNVMTKIKIDNTDFINFLKNKNEK